MKETIKLNQAVILAGGKGERLRPLTNKIPKPMAPINGVPFLDYLIDSILQVGIKRILILVGYEAGSIINRYEKRFKGKVEIGCSLGTAEDQTGKRLLDAYGLLDDHFLLLYGDNYWPINLKNMLVFYRKKRARALITVFNNKNGTGEYGCENNVEVGEDNFVKQYDKQRKSVKLNGVNIGYFIIDKRAIDPDISGNISFEEGIVKKLILEQQLIAYVADTQYYYITDMDSLRKFAEYIW